MAVTNKTKAQLIKELAALRQRNAQLAATVAAQRQAEAAVRASEQRYHHLVEQSLGLMCMHTLDGTLLAVNRGCTGVGLRARGMAGPESAGVPRPGGAAAL